MTQHFGVNGTSFYNASVLCNVAPQNSDTACFTIWIINGTDQFIILYISPFDIFSQRLTCGCHNIQIQQIFLRQFCLYRRDTACSVQVRNMCMPCRCQMAEIRHFFGNFIENLHIQFHFCFIGNCQQMQHTVGRTTQCHITGNCIINTSFVDDISCLDISFHQFHDRHASMLCQLHTPIGNIWNRAITGQCDPDGFAETIHAVCCIHPRTGTAAGAGIGFILI